MKNYLSSWSNYMRNCVWHCRDNANWSGLLTHKTHFRRQHDHHVELMYALHVQQCGTTHLTAWNYDEQTRTNASSLRHTFIANALYSLDKNQNELHYIGMCTFGSFNSWHDPLCCQYRMPHSFLQCIAHLGLYSDTLSLCTRVCTRQSVGHLYVYTGTHPILAWMHIQKTWCTRKPHSAETASLTLATWD